MWRTYLTWYVFSRKPLRRPSFFCPCTLQHVHGCLLKQPSSAQKPPRATDSTVDVAHTAARASGSTHQPGARRFTVEAGGSAFPTPPRDSRLPNQRFSSTDEEKESASSERGKRFPDPAGSPRQTRVSLQGVFSPKVRVMECTINSVSQKHRDSSNVNRGSTIFVVLVVSMLSTSWNVTLKCEAGSARQSTYSGPGSSISGTRPSSHRAMRPCYSSRGIVLMFDDTPTLERPACPRSPRLLSPHRGRIEQMADPEKPGIVTTQRPLEALLPLPLEGRHIVL